MRQAQAGNGEAYRLLLEDVCPDLRAFLRRRLSPGSDVDDLLQEVLLTLHRARHSYDPARPFEPWLFAIAANAAADAFRHVRTRLRWERLADDDAELEIAVANPGPPRSVGRLLAQLPESQRRAVEMVKLQGMTVEEAARVAGVSPGAPRVRIHRGYRALRAILLADE